MRTPPLTGPMVGTKQNPNPRVQHGYKDYRMSRLNWEDGTMGSDCLPLVGGRPTPRDF